MSIDIKNMTIAERIAEFWKRHEEIDTSLVPDTWLTWTGKRKGEEYRKYYQLSSGIVTEDRIPWIKYQSDGNPSYYCYNDGDDVQGIGHGQIKSTNRLMLNAGNECEYYYFKYDDELEIIEISVVNIDTHRYNSKVSQEENIRLWKRSNNYSTFFMERGSKDKYDINGNLMTEFMYEWRWGKNRTNDITNFKNWLKNMRRMNTLRTCASEFEHFAEGSLYGACGRALNPLYTYDLEDWFLRDNTHKTKGAVGKKIDELSSKPMKDLSFLKEQYKEAPVTSNRYYNHGDDIVYIDLSVDSEWAVLRYMFRRNDGSLDESYRVFVHNNGKVMLARKTGPNSWATATNISAGWRGSHGRIVNYEEMEKHRRLSYISDMVETFPEKARLGKIIVILRNPITEQLYKAGFAHIAKFLLKDNNVNQNISDVFGEVNLKEKNLFAKFGMNKTQMEILNAKFNTKNDYGYGAYYSYSYINYAVRMIKELLEISDISHIDSKTFSDLIGMVEMMKKASHTSNIKRDFSLQSLGFDTNQQIKIWLRLYRLAIKHQNQANYSNDRGNNIFRLLHDAISLYNAFPESMKPDFDIDKVDSYSDIVRLHDGITALYNAMKQEIADAKNKEKEEKMKKLDEKRKEIFEMEDDKFLIRLPHKLSEIVNEGRDLNHCVGGYADRHARGDTTILFLRKKDNVDKSFYTIECHGLDKKKGINVTQIHGFGNKWLGNNPEVVPFVLRWLRDKGIKCRDDIVLSTARGYSGYGATMIPKPEI